MQLRHIGKIHAVPARDERKRQKDGGDDGEQLHHPVLRDIHLGLVFAADLGGVFPQHLGLLPQVAHPTQKVPQPLGTAAVEQVGGILLQ